MSSCLWSSLLTRLTCLFTWWFIYMFFFFQRFFLFFNAQHSAPFDLGILLSNWRNILAWDRHGRDLSWSQCRSCGLLLLHVEWETPHIFDMLDFFFTLLSLRCSRVDLWQRQTWWYNGWEWKWICFPADLRIGKKKNIYSACLRVEWYFQVYYSISTRASRWACMEIGHFRVFLKLFA